MLHTTAKGRLPCGSGEEDFIEELLPYMGLQPFLSCNLEHIVILHCLA